MPELHTLILFSGAALLLAVMPGPGLFYVAGRTLASGRTDGLASCLGTMLGGLAHVAAGAIGVSALLMASAAAFSVLKLLGGIYLLFLALQLWRSASSAPSASQPLRSADSRRAFLHAVAVEAANPKTAAFFLALIPQFVVATESNVALQFAVLGLISVALNASMAILVVITASRLRDRLAGNDGMMRRLRQTSAAILGGLGVSLLLTRRPV
jgi:threonine/homoserine/homoserine lactone efflux protein